MLSYIIEGIIHIEDLPVAEFIESVRKINEFDITEKIDGANIVFGYDENGKFYTSREAKGGGRFYSEKDYPIRFWTTGFRSAHVALEKMTKNLVGNLILPGDSYVAEILFGEIPNTVPYKGIENQIVLLKPFSSDENIKERFDKLVETLKEKKVKVKLENVPSTPDGKNIVPITEEHVWVFDVVPKVDKSILDKEHLESVLEFRLKNLENYLNSPSSIESFTNLDILSIPLNKRPKNVDKEDWSILKEKIKEEREKVKEKIMNMKLDIKEELLNSLVRKLESKFGPKFEEGGWIEGVVFRDPQTKKEFKLVDKDIFTELNKFNWKIRSLLKDSNFSRKTRSYFTRIIEKISKILGYSPTELRKKIKNKEKIEIEKPFEEVDKEIKNILVQAIKALDKILNYYSKNKDKIKIYVEKVDRTFTYTDTHHRKTLETFAEFRSDLEEALKKLDDDKTIEDIITTLFGGKESILETKILNEGGNVFLETIPIKKEDILPTLKNLSEDFDIPFDMLKNNLLGSALIKQTSGDLDIAMPKEIYNELKEKIRNSNYSHKILKDVVHLKYPIANKNSFVQIDFMFGDVNWLKTYFKSPIEEEYKGVHLNTLLGEIARLVDRKESEEKVDGKPLWEERWRWSPVEGLIRIRSEAIFKNGKLLKKRNDIPLSKGIKNPDEVAKILLGEDAKKEDLESVNRIVNLFKKNRPEIYDEVIENWIDNLKQRNIKVPFDGII